MNSSTLSEILLTFRCTRVIETAEEVCRNSDEVETRRSEFHEPFTDSVPVVCPC
jgi:hypothetical protein